MRLQKIMDHFAGSEALCKITKRLEALKVMFDH